MTITADGQQVPRIRRRRRRDLELDSEVPRPAHPASPGVADEEMTTFFQMEEEAQQMTRVGHECPVPKPKGVLGELLGFQNARGSEQHQISTDGGR